MADLEEGERQVKPWLPKGKRENLSESRRRMQDVLGALRTRASVPAVLLGE